MTIGIYQRTPEMKTGKYPRIEKHNKHLSKSIRRAHREGRMKEAYKKISIIQKGKIPQNWNLLYTPEINEKRRTARLKQKLPTIDTSIELKVKDCLEENKIKYVHPFNLGNRFQCDFYLPFLNLIVECDGEYWHSREDMKKRDRAKDAYAQKCGFYMLRLKEEDINKGRIINQIAK